MSDETIYPTHQCFDDTVDFLNDLAARGAPPEVLRSYTVVHGICLMPPDGEPYAHGWLECDGFVIQAGIYWGRRIYYRTTVEELRAARLVWDETRYTLDEVIALDALDGDAGLPPYRADYKALCNDKRSDRPGEPRVWQAPPMAIIDAWFYESTRAMDRICSPCRERLRGKGADLRTTLERMDRVEENYDGSPEAIEFMTASTVSAEAFAWELYRLLCDDCKRYVPAPPRF
jgi:hypothetical protein